MAAVNDTTVKSAPKGAIDQIGECLSRIIHAFAEASEDAKIFMAKWDIKDGFWRMDCRAGEEWNFSYVLPQPEGTPVMLVVPTSLQMGWVESPPYFCAATENARDIATEYTDMPVGSLPDHKFTGYTVGGESYSGLPIDHPGHTFRSMIEVYMDDFMSLVIPVSQAQLSSSMMCFQQMTTTTGMTPFLKRNSKSWKDNTRPSKRCSVLTLMGRVKQCGSKLQNAKS